MSQLEKFGRVRLSQHFFMRDFLYSEVANNYRLSNIPDIPNLAIRVGRQLCTELLDPLVNTFGPIHVRSAYRSVQVNDKGNTQGHNCATNEANYAGHIWDRLDGRGNMGATACIVIPWFADQYDKGRDWRDLAWWLNDHLNHSGICFYPKLAAFNLTWCEVPEPHISSHIAPRGILRHTEGTPLEGTRVATDCSRDESCDRQQRYSDFPEFCGIRFPTPPSN